MVVAEDSLDAADVFDAWAREGRDVGMARRHLLTGGPVLDGLDLGGARFLDLGCGNGWAAGVAAERGACAVGVDAALGMLMSKAWGSRVGLVRGSFSRLPFAGGVFDVAFSMEALYYAGDVVEALGEAFRVLGEGGVLHVLVDYYEENEASHAWPEMTGVPMHRLSEASWGEAFEAAGFVDVATGRVRVEDDLAADWKATVGSLHVQGSCPV